VPVPETITKAFLQVISWDSQGDTCRPDGDKVEVQFNPETLKMAYSNQISGEDNNGGSAIQFTSKGTTKLSFDLWFDVSAKQPDNEAVDDVRKLTQKVIKFMETDVTGSGEDAKYTPPGCRFQWGSFLFEGVMDSISENLEFFSAQGKPLRASMSISLSNQAVEVKFSQTNAEAASQPGVGTQAQQQAEAGDSVQAMNSREGCSPENWQPRAQAQGIEDPLRMQEGSLLPSSIR